MWRRRMKMTLTEFSAAVAVAAACQRRPTPVVRNRARHGKRPWVGERDSNTAFLPRYSRGTSSPVEMMGERELGSIDGGNG
ncbi:hypothetical protein BJV77DRAFT_1007271 [Russula vinacea]|nr:hypothetical protein BJV77DRAFT_1007271 [Russula vinacea]